MQDKPGTVEAVDKALQTFINSFLSEDLDFITGTAAVVPSQQATATHWLPSAANSHAPLQVSYTPPQQPKVRVYADLQKSL